MRVCLFTASHEVLNEEISSLILRAHHQLKTGYAKVAMW